jgi:hypothetical protein
MTGFLSALVKTSQIWEGILHKHESNNIKKRKDKGVQLN